MPLGMTMKVRPTLPLRNQVATSDPTVSDDETQGYEIESLWFNLASEEVFICISPTTGAAVWRQISNNAQIIASQKEAPNEHFLGQSLLHYPESGRVSKEEVQYTRVWMTAGLALDRMRVYVDSGASGSRYVRMGLYNQSNPLNSDLGPNSRVAETASGAPTTNQTFYTANLTSSYTVPTTGYYWLAMITDSRLLRFAMTAVHRANFLPVRRESSTGTVLPTTTGTLANVESSVVYVAALEEAA